MAVVFLSHASADKPVVRRIADALRAAGHNPWLDEDQILVGDSIPAAVERGLRAADFVIVCLSRAAAERGWVEAERDASVMQQFRDRKARILPVRIEPVDPPHLIAHIAHVDLFPSDDAFQRGIDRLVRSVTGHEMRATEPSLFGSDAGTHGAPPDVKSSATTSPRARVDPKRIIKNGWAMLIAVGDDIEGHTVDREFIEQAYEGITPPTMVYQDVRGGERADFVSLGFITDTEIRGDGDELWVEFSYPNLHNTRALLGPCPDKEGLLCVAAKTPVRPVPGDREFKEP